MERRITTTAAFVGGRDISLLDSGFFFFFFFEG
jgi:hypothetical protein